MKSEIARSSNRPGAAVIGRPTRRRGPWIEAGVVLLLAVGGAAAGGELAVVSVEPAAHTLTASTTTAITVHFDQPLAPATVNASSFWAFGRWSGTVTGTYTFSDGDRTVTLTPSESLSAGETVMVILSHHLEAAGGAALRSAGYSYQFWTAVSQTTLTFSELGTLTTRTSQAVSTRAYGGIATDLNNDGYLDITTVNEDSADLRVFLNQADGTGLFNPFLQPTSPVNTQASPSEPADFNHDGFADICVANISTASVSILLGNGDGTYGPQQEITVGSSPRGIAVLDADGDGDVDIVNTNSGTSNMSILFNDGSGVFGLPNFFEGGGAGEWALAAADMNDDGIMDLVIGARSGQTIVINTGDGDGTFTIAGSAPAGGPVWMLVCGDLDGNGTEDVAAVNSSANNGAILRGDGAGNLFLAQTYATDPFSLATDIGDLDGDGDLDWMTSSFSGDWWLYANQGNGTFVFDQEFLAPAAASCSLLFDYDNDGDLDLGLIDELADVVILYTNNGIAGDVNGDCTVNVLDLIDLLLCFGLPAAPGCEPQDVNNDGAVNVLDLIDLLLNFGTSCP